MVAPVWIQCAMAQAHMPSSLDRVKSKSTVQFPKSSAQINLDIQGNLGHNYNS